MTTSLLMIGKPQRWDVPFGPEMTEEDVDRLLEIEPFSKMDPDRFPPATPLRGILANDTRILTFNDGDIIVRDGDYGSSAFIILEGTCRVAIEDLPPAVLGRRERERTTFFGALSQLWKNPKLPEVRDVKRYRGARGVAARGEGEETRVFLQDVNAIISSHKTVPLPAGELFGELAALGRTPRTATVFAEGPVKMLEIRWQGLRDLRRGDQALKQHIDQRYRERSLKIHLEETPLFKHLSGEELTEVANATEFETFGDFDWYGSYKRVRQESAAGRLRAEPVIVEQGHYPNGLVLIRAGFARVSRRYGHGEQTVSYLGKGQWSGLEELARNWRNPNDQVANHYSLRAVGYVDTLRVPTPVVEKYVFERLSPEQLDSMMVTIPEEHRDDSAVSLPIAGSAVPTSDTTTDDGDAGPTVNTGTFEFLVENRFINGTATMMIDLDRCTRCDDCVRACAGGHTNNPRFIRHGMKHDHYMIANACMHCQDPVCMIGCPTGAIARDAVGGQVTINDNTCIGCSTCANSCPYSNIRMVEIRDNRGQFIVDQDKGTPIVKATKCDLCVDQLGGPACERACPHDALKRVDMREVDHLARWLNR